MADCSIVPLSFPLWVALAAPAAPAPTTTAPEPSWHDFGVLAPAAPEAPAPEAPAPEAPAPEPGTPAPEAPAEPAPGPEVAAPFDLPPPASATPGTPPPPASTPIPPPPPRPIRWRADVGLGLGSTMVLRDRGFLALSNDRNLLALDVSTILDFRLAQGRFFVGGGVAYQLARSSDAPYQVSIYNLVTLHEPRLLGRASFMMVEGVDVFARAGIGPSIARLDVQSDFYDFDSDSGGYHTAAQRTVIPRVDAQGGLSLYLPKQWLRRKQAARATAGLELSLGYTWRGTIDARPELAREGDVIDTTAPRWGELSLHGLAWGLQLFVRVM